MAAKEISESLGSIANVVGFSEVCEVAFAGLAGLASPDSYLSRLSEHIRAMSNTLLGLKHGFSVLQDEKTRLDVDHEQLQQDHTELQKDRDTITAERNDLVLKVRLLFSMVTQLKDAKAKRESQEEELQKSHRQQAEVIRQMKTDEADVIGRLRYLLPSLANLVPPDASFQVQAGKFLDDYPHFLARHALNWMEPRFQVMNDKLQAFTAKFHRFHGRLLSFLEYHGEPHQPSLALRQMSQRHDASYMETLTMLFPEWMRPSNLDETARIRDQLVRTRALLQSTFKLIPDFRLELPDDLYQLALGLRRQLGAGSLFQRTEDLLVDMDMDAIQMLDGGNSFIGKSLSHFNRAKLLLGKTVMLDTVVPLLAKLLEQTVQHATPADVTRMLGELKLKIDQGNSLRARVIEFHAKIDKMTTEMGALPESVSSVISELKVDGE
jgi:hypothetical protein